MFCYVCWFLFVRWPVNVCICYKQQTTLIRLIGLKTKNRAQTQFHFTHVQLKHTLSPMNDGELSINLNDKELLLNNQKGNAINFIKEYIFLRMFLTYVKYLLTITRTTCKCSQRWFYHLSESTSWKYTQSLI